MSLDELLPWSFIQPVGENNYPSSRRKALAKGNNQLRFWPKIGKVYADDPIPM